MQHIQKLISLILSEITRPVLPKENLKYNFLLQNTILDE